jgi:hypothetical protein
VDIGLIPRRLVTGCSSVILEMDLEIGRLNCKVWASGAAHEVPHVLVLFLLSEATPNALVSRHNKESDSPSWT